ncbi:MAG: YbhB/YbcL family Raf kinase inhibitor-like protein [Desulfovibrionaceae bacterium]|jgi:phosphatidylethanolamine-binding protein (PEBP) family uncharacterized protein
MPLALHCGGLDETGALLPQYTGLGLGASPPVSWEGVPPSAVALALLLQNLDAPLEPAVHWLVFNIPAQADAILAAVAPDMLLDGGAKHGLNAARRPGYLPPRPEPGRPLRMRFSLFALDRAAPAGPGASLRQIAGYLSQAIERADLALLAKAP